MSGVKTYSNDTLTLDDLLQDLKRHISQAEIILSILDQHGARANGRELIRSYPGLYNDMLALQKDRSTND
jgi:hypothetical protein